jgi:hypothetical protein
MRMNSSRAALPAASSCLVSPWGEEANDSRNLIGPTATERDFSALRQAFRPSGGIARGDDLARLLEDHRCGDFVSLARFIAQHEIFAFQWRDSFWIPMFQFSLRDLSIREGPHRVLAELETVFDGWGMAVWFAQRNSWLHEQRPVDLLESDLDSVLQAACADRFIANG